jgi:hypothetical protein
MGGFTVQSQVLGVVNQMTVDLTTGSVSGILGLAFQSLANSGATPWWQTVQKEAKWDEPVMSFFLTRYVSSPPLPERVPFILTRARSWQIQGCITRRCRRSNDHGWNQLVSVHRQHQLHHPHPSPVLDDPHDVDQSPGWPVHRPLRE